MVPVPAVVAAVKVRVFASASVSLAITSLLVSVASSATVNVSSTATGAKLLLIFPDELIVAENPSTVILLSWSAVIALLLVPKEISSTPAPVIVSAPAPQVAAELSAKANDVTAASKAKLKVPVPMVTTPAPVWLALIFSVIGSSVTSTFPLNTLAVFTVIVFPVVPESLEIVSPEARKVPLAAVLTSMLLPPPNILNPPEWPALFDVDPNLIVDASPDWNWPAPDKVPSILMDLSALATNLVVAVNVNSELEPNVMLPAPAPFTWTVSVSVELNTIGRFNVNFSPALLFWIGCVTAFPLMVRMAELVAVTSISPDAALDTLSCPISWLESTTKLDFKVTLVLAVGVPVDQLASVDHRLSVPALSKVVVTTFNAAISPFALIWTADPFKVVLPSWSAVSPLALVPIETSLSWAPVITSFPRLCQVSLELSAKATEVTSSPISKFKFCSPILIVPIADWFSLTVKFKLYFFCCIFPLKTSPAPSAIIILWPVEV